MYLPMLIAMLAMALSCSAAAVLSYESSPDYRPVQLPPFNVTGFEASVVVLSHREYYRFNVTLSPPSHPTTGNRANNNSTEEDKPYPPNPWHHHRHFCEGYGTTTSEELSSLPQTLCQIDNSTQYNNSRQGIGRGTDPDQYRPVVSFKWSMGKDDGSADLLIVRHHPPSNIMDQALYTVPKDQMPIMGQGDFRHQMYNGPGNFSVPAWRFVSS